MNYALNPTIGSLNQAIDRALRKIENFKSHYWKLKLGTGNVNLNGVKTLNPTIGSLNPFSVTANSANAIFKSHYWKLKPVIFWHL